MTQAMERASSVLGDLSASSPLMQFGLNFRCSLGLPLQENAKRHNCKLTPASSVGSQGPPLPAFEDIHWMIRIHAVANKSKQVLEQPSRAAQL